MGHHAKSKNQLDATRPGGHGVTILGRTVGRRTIWPARLPEGFDVARVMDLGKNPGLGLRALHARGITGAGVGIGIIDQALLVQHVEYKKQLRLYEEIHWLEGSDAQMHGPAVASIAVGKGVGVAPEADLHYIAEWHARSTGASGFEIDLPPLARSIAEGLAPSWSPWIRDALPARPAIPIMPCTAMAA
jgi:hypothetical protein